MGKELVIHFKSLFNWLLKLQLNLRKLLPVMMLKERNKKLVVNSKDKRLTTKLKLKRQENNSLHSKLKVQRLKVLVMLLQKQKHALKLLRLKEKLLFNKQNFVLKQARLNLKLNLNKQPNDNKLKSPINKNLTNWNFLKLKSWQKLKPLNLLKLLKPLALKLFSKLLAQDLKCKLNYWVVLV